MKKIVVLGFVGLAVSILLNSCTKCENTYLTKEERSLFPKEGTKMVFKFDNTFDTITYGKPESFMKGRPNSVFCKKSKFEEINQKMYHSDINFKDLGFYTDLRYNTGSYKEEDKFNFGANGYDQTIQYANRTFNDVRVYENPKKICDSVSYYDKTLSYKYSRSAGLLELTICDSNKTQTLSRVF